jgi:hypothetical protein
VALTAKSVVRRKRTSAPQEADELPGTPAVQRQSLPADQQPGSGKQRQATQKYHALEADVLEETDAPEGDALLEEGKQYTERTTDDLIEEHAPVRPRGKVTSIPPRSRRMAQRMVVAAPRKVNKVPLLVGITFAIIVMVGLVRFILFIGDCLTDYHNTLTYGPNRTTIVSGIFGHNDDSPTNPTYVIAINLDGTLLIEEVPAGDVSKTRTYPTGLMLVGGNAKKVPVILTVRDVNGDHKPDVLIEIPGQNMTLKLINTGTDFTLVTK